MNATPYNTTNYKRKHNWTLGENKPNSNPIKPNLRKAKMNINSLITKDYRKKDDFVVRINKPNSNPISVKPKMSANVYVIEDYENETAFRLQKNKPKQSQFPKGQNELKIACQKIWPHPIATGRIERVCSAEGDGIMDSERSIANSCSSLEGARTI